MAPPSAVKFSIVVPTYNEEQAIAQTLETMNSTLSSAEPYELIVVNDGSTDGTLNILQNLTPKYPYLRIISHQSNRGYGAAIKTGIRRATASLIVTTDADGTYPNDKILELVEKCEGYDMVVGARIGKDVKYSKLRAFPKFFLRKWMSWIAGRNIPDINSGLRVFRKSTSETFLKILPDSFSFTVTLTLAMLTNYRPVSFIPIDYHSRIGSSKIKPIRDTLRFLMLILRTGTYFAPLRIFSPLVGLLLIGSVGSLLYDIFVLRNLTDKTVLLFLFAMNTGMFALLADMIDKRTGN